MESEKMRVENENRELKEQIIGKEKSIVFDENGNLIVSKAIIERQKLKHEQSLKGE